MQLNQSSRWKPQNYSRPKTTAFWALKQNDSFGNTTSISNIEAAKFKRGKSSHENFNIQLECKHGFQEKFWKHKMRQTGLNRMKLKRKWSKKSPFWKWRELKRVKIEKRNPHWSSKQYRVCAEFERVLRLSCRTGVKGFRM